MPAFPGSQAFLRSMDRPDLDRIGELLRAACAFDRAADVADELVFGDALDGVARATGAFVRVPGDAPGSVPGSIGRDELAGIAVVSGAWIRILAVHPAHRTRGVGSQLLSHAERDIRARGHTVIRIVDQPGNYLAPGVDVRNRDTIEWLERRGYACRRENVNLLVDVRDNPLVSEDRLAALTRGLDGRYRIARATETDRSMLLSTVEREFSRGWAFELGRALESDPPAVHVAACTDSGQLAAFAAHDGNNRGLGWFGPTGTLPEHRKRGLGQALLVACLLDVARAGHDVCEIAWIGPRGFYERSVGVLGERRFAAMRKELS